MVIRSELGGKPFTRTVVCRRGDPILDVDVSGFTPRRRTVTCRFEVSAAPTTLEMDTLGGTIVRPRERVHQPTFWPVPSRVTLRGECGAVHVGFESPTAVSFSPAHELEWMVARNPVKERAFGWLPVLAHPIGGTVDGLQTHRASLFATPGGGVSAELRRRLERAWLPAPQRPLRDHAASLVRCDDPDVAFAALKRADEGRGVIVRLACDLRAPRTVRVWVPSHELAGASLCDAREQDLAPLALDAGKVLVPLTSRWTTVRLVLGRPVESPG